MTPSARTGALCAMALLGAATGLGGCMSGATYGTGEVPEMAIFHEVTGGIGTAKKTPIEYQPRAPLVMPPAAGQLPPPVETADAGTGTAWPRDPDADKRPKNFDEKLVRDQVSPADYDRLKPLGALAQDPSRDPNEKVGGNADHNDHPAYAIVHSKEQQKQVRAALDDAHGIGTTGERRYLTEPPETLRQPASTAPAEFDDIKKKHTGGWLSGIFGG